MNETALQQRFERIDSNSTRDALLDNLRIRRGSLADYAVLKQFHYRAPMPAGVTAVHVMEQRQPSVVGRFLEQPEMCPAIVAVLVQTLPPLSCRLRDHAIGNRYRRLTLRQRAIMVNREFRTISRVVVDPRFRGLGLAVKLVQHALNDPQTPYTEALAAMGRVNPFFERAGMVRYDRPVDESTARLLDVLDYLQIDSAQLLSPATLISQLQDRSADIALLERELRRWSRSNRRDADGPLNELLQAAGQRLRFRPVYYLFSHSNCDNNQQDNTNDDGGGGKRGHQSPDERTAANDRHPA